MTADLVPSGTPPFSAPDRSSLRRYLPFPGFGETHSVRHLAEQENHLFVPACRAGRAGVIPQVAVAHRSRPVAEVTASRPGPASGEPTASANAAALTGPAPPERRSSLERRVSS